MKKGKDSITSVLKVSSPQEYDYLIEEKGQVKYRAVMRRTPESQCMALAGAVDRRHKISSYGPSLDQALQDG